MATVMTGGIITTSKNVCIPLDNAGVGDAIAISSTADGTSKSNFIAIAGASVQATPPSGYVWYGVVYGRERNGLMIRSLVPKQLPWASTGQAGVVVTLDTTNHATVIANTTSYGGLMRNGGDSANQIYVGMSVGEIISRCGTSSTSTALHPNSPYLSLGTPPMSKANFDADTSLAKTIYGTYENYVAQVLTVMKGGKAGVFAKRCGKANTREMANNRSVDGHTFNAAVYCYTYKAAGSSEADNHWWLPDMYELAVMMNDSSFERCAYAHSILGGNTERAASRWSSVRCGSTSAWLYSGNGFSTDYSFSNSYWVCPVTLLSI